MVMTDIAMMYRGGMSLTQICAKTGRRSPGGLYTALVKMGVPIRSQRKLSTATKDEMVRRYASGESSGVLAKCYGLTPEHIWKICQQRGLARSRQETYARRRLPVRSDFFDRLDNELSAYWFGFLAADGCISANKWGIEKLSITLAQRDEAHLLLFKTDLAATASLGYPRTEHPKVHLVVNNRHLVAALRRHGMRPRKSVEGFDYPHTLPTSMHRHFIRGYFDGDGCFSERSGKFGSLRFSGHTRFLKTVRRVLNAQAFDYCRARGHWAADLRCAAGIGQLVYGGRQMMLDAYEYLYADASRYLARKHEVFHRVYLRALAYDS